MFLSIIIPAYNEQKIIAPCLRDAHAAALAALAPARDYEIIVVDNNSSDRTAELARAHGARVVFELHNQIARARNAGAENAKGEWLLFLDADSSLSPELLSDTVEAMRRDEVIGGGALIAFPKDAPWDAKLGPWIWTRISLTMRWAAGAYIFCRGDAFREIGGFSNDLYASEELDFSKRMKRLAAQREQRFIILRRNRLLTSDRKAHLYPRTTLLRLLWRTISSPRKSVRDREICHMWYDGKR
jgi:glycosyltransferase involved in cell wall biosynthesis